MKKSKGTATHYAFMIGALVSAIVGVLAALGSAYASNQWIPVILVLLGLAVGLVNVTAKETLSFLVAATVLVLLTFGSNVLNSLDTLIAPLGTLLGSATQAFAFFVGAAAIVVAVKQAWSIAQN